MPQKCSQNSNPIDAKDKKAHLTMASPLDQFLHDMIHEKAEEFGEDVQVVEIVSDEAYPGDKEILHQRTYIDEDTMRRLRWSASMGDKKAFATLISLRNESARYFYVIDQNKAKCGSQG
jgi:hypothetical protein